MSSLPPGNLLDRAACWQCCRRLCENVDEFAKPITLEMGKLFREAQAEVTLSAEGRDLSRNTMRNIHSCVRGVLTQAVEDGIL